MKKAVAILLCVVICVSMIPTPALAARDTSFEETLADDLKLLGLFQGVTDTNFDLGRAPTRTEALIMLIRVLGKEAEALGGTWSHPFTDVVDWADPYIGYAYQKGLTDGVTDTTFGTGTASAAMYLTFVLRALGYSDKVAGDFTWDNPYSLARSVGILPDCVNTASFWRADVVLVSYAALPVRLKDSTQTLAQKLIAAGVFTQAAYDTYYDADAIQNHMAEKRPLTAAEIYESCSSSVFWIKTYDVSGYAYAQGSGFFVDRTGIAVTNHHVLENALSAEIVLTDGTVGEITGVLYFNPDLDYAVVKTTITNAKPLEIGDSSAVKGGEEIFTIGNPQGLTNTISNGIISNPYREDLNGMIQITAPISSGSSGGALLNVYGEVIGITTASYVSGQNLNFAVPINEVVSKDEDLSTYADRNGMFSIREYAAFNAYLEYQEIPGAFLNNVREVEPNDLISQAQFIDNGMSIWGTIDDQYLDIFLVRCNTVGTIEMPLFSKSAPAYVRDLIFAIEPIDTTGGEVGYGQYYEFSDGTAAQMLTYQVPRPGIYAIYVLSAELYQYYNLNTDYAFYYTFKPQLSLD